MGHPPDYAPILIVLRPISACPNQAATRVRGWTYRLRGLGETGPVVRMEMWLNGAKVANFRGDHFNTHPIFFDAFYTLEIWEVDSNGHALKADVFQDGPC